MFDELSVIGGYLEKRIIKRSGTGIWFSTRIFRVLSFSEVPQIIVQERVDQAYDGGKPVWGKPAIVYASGSVASIGVLVFGIRKCGNVMDQNREYTI